MIKKVKELKPGELFKLAGFEWIKLEDSEMGAKCLAANAVGELPFDTEGQNDWRKSSLRTFLNVEFLQHLYEGGAKRGDFLSFVSVLTSDDGLKNYGTSEDKIALITCDDYRKYRSLIPMIDGWWWTITPWSCNPSYSYYVRIVYTSGALNNDNAYYGYYGVRPLIKLRHETEVEVRVEEVDKYDSDSVISLNKLTNQIKYWAVDRELNNADPKGQMLKLLEEAGELAEGIAKDRPEQIKDSIGDVYVVLTILAMQLDLDIKECIEAAYNEIKDRKGRMVDGVYVKEEDLDESN